MIRVTFGSSKTGRVEELYVLAESLGLTYMMLRTDRDETIAEFDRDIELWIRKSDGTFWTDIDISQVPE